MADTTQVFYVHFKWDKSFEDPLLIIYTIPQINLPAPLPQSFHASGDPKKVQL